MVNNSVWILYLKYGKVDKDNTEIQDLCRRKVIHINFFCNMIQKRIY